MPVVNLENGDIINAQKDSLTYFHEKGHIEFSKTYYGILFDYCSSAYAYAIIFFLVINQFFDNFWIKIVNLALIIAIIGMYLYEEIYCWRYAYKVKNGN